jgi:hypothetical protein
MLQPQLDRILKETGMAQIQEHFLNLAAGIEKNMKTSECS